MTKIKPKKGWHAHSKPSFYHAEPVPPKKVIREERHEEVATVNIGWRSNVPLTDLIPEGTDPKDLVINLELDEREGYGDHELKTFRVHVTERENPKYDAEMVRYEKEMAKYKAVKKAHAQEVKEWKAWKAELDKASLEARLEDAQKLLEEHGRLKQ